MTLKEFLYSIKGSNQYVRIFSGCRTLFNGNISKISYEEWKKMRPYFGCKLHNDRIIGEVIVVAI